MGRSRELMLLRVVLERMLSGRGSLVLVTGEAGIGKTTLVNRLADEALRHGATVLRGGCYDLTTTPPYGPWLELFERYRPMPGQPPLPDTLSSPAVGTHVASQAEWFLVVRTFLTDLAAGQPLVLVIEDLHWVDSASLDLLRYLARQITTEPIMLVTTYRTDELTRGGPLSLQLPALIREARTERITLSRFSDPEVRALVAMTYELADPEIARLVAYLQAHADGNPFFIGELLLTLHDQGILRQEDCGWAVGDLRAVPVPPLVQHVIERRLAYLAPAVRELLVGAAVIGHDVPLDLWQAASHASDEQLATAIKAALDLHLLTQSATSDGVHFVHALVREALYAGTVLIHRRQWHLRVGEALAAMVKPDAAVVAFHFQQAADPRAVAWLLRAGERAHAIYAPHAAIAYLTDAIALAEHHSVAWPLTAFRTRGLAYEMIGDFERARRDHEHVRERAAATEDQHAAWQALLDLGAL